MKRHRVLLVHSESWLGTARLPRVFARHGVATTAIAPSRSLVAASRFVDELIEAPPQMPALIALLRATIESRGDEFAFVLLADDPLIEALGAHAGEDWLDRCYPVDHRGDGVRLVTSKFAFLDAARRAGLPLPQSGVAAGENEAVALARTIGYPVMIKRESGSGGRGVRRADSDAEVRATVAAFGDPVVNVEELVDGMVGGTEVLYDHGVPVCSFPHGKPQRYPAPYGPSAIREIVDIPGMDAMIEGCGAITNFHGFVAICWLYDPTRSRLVLLEMNPRPGSGMQLPPYDQIFGEGLRAMLAGRAGAYRYQRPSAGRRYRMFPQDVRRVLEQRDGVGIVAWTLGLPAALDVPWDDPPLLRALVRELVYDFAPSLPRLVARVRHAETSK